MMADMATTPASETAFGAIACKTRRRLLDALVQREMSVNELVGIARVSQPAVSQHLRVLKDAGLVEERRDGRFRRYRLEAEPLAEVMEWVRAYEKLWTG